MPSNVYEGWKGEAANPTHCIFQSIIKNVLLMEVNKLSVVHQHNPQTISNHRNKPRLWQTFSHKYVKYSVIAVLWEDH